MYFPFRTQRAIYACGAIRNQKIHKFNYKKIDNHEQIIEKNYYFCIHFHNFCPTCPTISHISYQILESKVQIFVTDPFVWMNLKRVEDLPQPVSRFH